MVLDLMGYKSIKFKFISIMHWFGACLLTFILTKKRLTRISMCYQLDSLRRNFWDVGSLSDQHLFSNKERMMQSQRLTWDVAATMAFSGTHQILWIFRVLPKWRMEGWCGNCASCERGRSTEWGDCLQQVAILQRDSVEPVSH